MIYYDFDERLSFSTTTDGRSYEQIIQTTLPGVVSVVKTDIATDKTGIDYYATLRRGARIGIDLKLRDKLDVKKYWKHDEEEIALEVWSVRPNATRRLSGKAGWTLDESKATDYTLHAFHPENSDRVFLLPFQLLRKAFRKNVVMWAERYKTARQDSGSWESECVFVPVSVVLDSIKAASVCCVSHAGSGVGHAD